MEVFSFKQYTLISFAFSGFFSPLSGQRTIERTDPNKHELHWTTPVTTRFSITETKTFLCFDGASYDSQKDFLPVFTQRHPLPAGSNSATATIQNPVFGALDQASIIAMGSATSFLTQEAQLTVHFTLSRKEPFANVSILPLRKNPSTGQIEKLLSFSVDIRGSANELRSGGSASIAFASSSILASGTWYRMGVTNTGVHKLSYNFLSGLGIDMSVLNPSNLRLYGNGHGQLPYSNTGAHQDDLLEYAITVRDLNSNGNFDTDDYALFYGTSPHTWKYDATHGHYHHSVHNYSDTTFYFITSDLGPGKRIQSQASSTAIPTHIVSTFDDYQFHEFDNENMIKSGREWYGEKFDILNSYPFTFTFPNIDMTELACTEVDLISRTENPVTYIVNAQSCNSSVIPGLTSNASYYGPYAAQANMSVNCNPTGTLFNVTITNQNPTVDGAGWLNWVRVNARRHLKMSGSQMSFRDSRSAGTGNVAQYVLDNYSTDISIWDVTDLANIGLQTGTLQALTFTWTLQADSLREFIAFNRSNYFTPVNFGPVPNQNLHAMQPVDFIIISHPDFLEQSEELGQLHLINDSLTYLVVTPQQIYNEFSSGAQDVTAIRDFVKMIYDRAVTPAEIPRYLLLFGDGSYDNKHRMPGNTNFIPTFQNLNSLAPIDSYVADEYYGLLDDPGGFDVGDNGSLDIGIGRFPVRTVSEAQTLVNKVRAYMTRQQPITNPSVCASDVCGRGGDWKNWLCFIGDDEDNNVHMIQANSLANYVDTAYDNFNIDKIFIDGYQQLQTPGGERYPTVNEAIDKRVDMGALMINYTGHGGEVGLAHERILEVSQINAWNNICNMPLFITATCEFSRFDDPARTSAGELILLNNNGGGIGLLTTVRLVYSIPNFTLNSNFYDCAFEPINGEMPRIGDIYRITKVNSGFEPNHRNFTLLGDPALRLNYPVNQVKTTEVNNVVITSQPDTLRALSHVTIEGYVADNNGNVMSNFNGVLYPTVFDKAKSISTLANDDEPPYTFQLQKSVLYHGKASVVNGYFSYSFVVPRDIAYQYGKGRVSYLADNGQTDASGNHENIIIGGSNPNAPVDVTGPKVKLYLNDSNFVFGGITNSSPKLFALIRDSNGVNTVGNGIGHDVVAILDDETGNAIVLNEYYQADMNSYQSGRIIYPFENLSPGKHTLALKVWDVYNNSSTVKTEFTVTDPAGLALDHVINYPNPFTTNTSFFIEYNQCCTEYDIMIRVFTVSGKLVKTINEHVISEGFRSDAIEWDGKDDYNDKIGRGVYIYYVVARTRDGMTAEKYEKLVIL